MLNATDLLLLISFVLESRLTRVRILIKVELARANSRKRAICPAEKNKDFSPWACRSQIGTARRAPTHGGFGKVSCPEEGEFAEGTDDETALRAPGRTTRSQKALFR
jgi:hypothetical protein